MKNIGIFLTATIFILFSFTNSGFTQTELENLKLVEADLGRRLSELKVEKKAISEEHNALRIEFTNFAQRKMGYDVKCSGQTFHRDNQSEMQIARECGEEKAWLETTQKILRGRKEKNDKREEKYKKDLVQLKLDSEIYQAKKKAAIEKAAQDIILTFKDQGIMDWVIKNVKFEIRDDPGQQNQLSPWASNSKLVFTKSFLEETMPMRENLIAFEAGKVFWNTMKDKPVGGGKTLEMWFTAYASAHNSVIENMKAAKYQNESLSILGDIDTTSFFGYIFRAQALQLDKPEGKKAQEEWDRVVYEFQKHISPLLQGK